MRNGGDFGFSAEAASWSYCAIRQLRVAKQTKDLSTKAGATNPADQGWQYKTVLSSTCPCHHRQISITEIVPLHDDQRGLDKNSASG